MEPTKDTALTTPSLRRAGSSAGSSKSGDPAKIKEALARIKNKKEENASDVASGKAPATPSAGSNSARKQLQSWRAKCKDILIHFLRMLHILQAFLILQHEIPQTVGVTMTCGEVLDGKGLDHH